MMRGDGARLPEATRRDGERKRRKVPGVSLLGWTVIRLISAVDVVWL